MLGTSFALASGFCSCIAKAYKWLCIDNCSTADSLLSLSFAINSIFTGLAFSRFNLFGWMKRVAQDCVARSTDARFLKKLERLSKGNESLRHKLVSYVKIVDVFDEVTTKGSVRWEWLRRCVSIAAAVMAFVFLSVECKSRMGVVLVLPYVVLLLAYLIRVTLVTCRVRWRFDRLDDAMGLADDTDDRQFEVADCITKLKEYRLALSGKTTRRKSPDK